MSEPNHSDTHSGARSIIIATAGHVDHGKTSLVNHITGTDTDTLAEEKARGLTINLGFAYYHYPTEDNGDPISNTIGFVDVPGHTDFINNMLAGVNAVDAAMLVVAADDGIMPQTREHLAIIDLLGISLGFVALTKIDRCDDQRVESVKQEIEVLLETTSLEGSPIFEVSNETGAGIPLLIDHLQSLVARTSNKNRDFSQQHFRYLIDRSFAVKGIGTVVTGSVRAGIANVGQNLLHTGSGELTRLKGLRQDTMELQQAHQGQRVAININVNHKLINRGDWLIEAAIYRPVNRFDASVRFINDDFKVRSNTQYHLHLGASHHIVTLRRLGDEDTGYYQLKTADSVIAHFGDRFVLRDPASQHTIGGGIVIDIFIPRRGRSSAIRLQILKAMDQASLAALGSLLQIQPEGVDLTQFAVCRNIADPAIKNLQQSLESEKSAHIALFVEKQPLPVLLHETFFQQYRQKILDRIARYHEQHTNQQGISEPALSREVDFGASHTLFHAILQILIKQESIKRTGTLLHLPTHRTALTKEEREFMAKIRPILEQAGTVPPRTRELIELTGISLKPLEQILRQMTKAGNLIQVADNRHYLPDTIMELADFTEKIARENNFDEGFSVIQFRDASGIGRNLCIEILEFFDRIGFTRRDGNSRFVRTGKENIFGK